MKPPWYIIEDYGIRDYVGNEPAFYDAKQFAWAAEIEANWQIIAQEFAPLINGIDSGEMKPYYNTEIQFPPQKWKTLGLLFWGKKNKKNWTQYPQTTALLSKIPGLVGVSLSMLEAGAEIKPHGGETNGIIRCHLGLQIPETLPNCGFQVLDEQRSWEDGKLLLFTDAHEHKAWNKTDKNRFILLFDVIRPEFIDRKNEICRSVLAMLSMDFIARKFKLNFIYSASKKTQLLYFRLFKIAWWFYAPIHRFLNIF